MASYLFLHGTPGSARDWDLLIARAPAGARCVAIDLPDHGDAPDDTSEDYESTFAAVIEAVAARPEPVVLVGHSFGAWLAAFLAPRLEPRVERLVLVDGLSKLSAESAAEFIELGAAIASGAIPAAQLAIIAAARWLPSSPAPELVARVEAMLGSQTPARIGRVVSRYARLAAPDHEVQSIPIHTDIVHVRGDVTVPLASGEALLERTPRGRLHLFEGEGHFPHWTDPDRLAAIVFGG